MNIFIKLAVTTIIASAAAHSNAQLIAINESERASLQAQESSRGSEALSHLLALRGKLGLDRDSGFRSEYGYTDEFGMLHLRFQHLYKGVAVYNSHIVTHQDKDGQFSEETRALKGERLAQGGFELNATLTADNAIQILRNDWAFQGSFAYEPDVKLVLYPIIRREIRPNPEGRAANAADVSYTVESYQLAYKIEAIEEEGEPEAVAYIIDATTGSIIARWDNLHTNTAVSGTGNSQYSGTVLVNTTRLSDGTYRLQDTSRGAQPCNPYYSSLCANTTTDLAYSSATNSGIGNLYTDPDNTWGNALQYNYSLTDTAATSGQTTAVDAHYGMTKAWEMYKYVFGRNGVDNLGTATLSRVHYDKPATDGSVDGQYSNAHWDDRCFCMTYGDGDSTNFYSFTPLDVAGHEMTHGVTSKTAALIYSGESGGLNEATSDIFGVMLEFYARGAQSRAAAIPSAGTDNAGNAADYFYGEQMIVDKTSRPALRYMFKPSIDFSSPDAWSEDLNTLEVHSSSAPMNRAFYFMALGITAYASDNSRCTGTLGAIYTHCYSSNYLLEGSVGIGNDKAAKIWYRALTAAYLVPDSDYFSARIAALIAAKDLYGSASSEYQVVSNAFAAINVGVATSTTDFDKPAVTVNSVTGTTGTITFSANYTDQTSGVAQVTFLVDDVPQCWANIPNKKSGTATCSFDSSQIANGGHTLSVRADDMAGNRSVESASVGFTISNYTQQLLINSGFEAGIAPWHQYFNSVTIPPSPLQAHGGDFALQLNTGTGNGSTYQYIDLPANAKLTLSYSVMLDSKNYSGKNYLKVNANSKICSTIYDNNANQQGVWQTFSCDISEYAGSAIKIGFYTTNSSGSSTVFWLDDVQVTSSPLSGAQMSTDFGLMEPGEAFDVAVVFANASTPSASWSIVESNCGSLVSNGLTATFTAPSQAGISCHVQAQSNGLSATAEMRTIYSTAYGQGFALQAGDSNSMLVRRDGSLWGWGYNYYSQLGIGNSLNVYSPTLALDNLTGQVMTSVWMGSPNSYHGLALKTDGTVYGSGGNVSGQLGADQTSYTKFVQSKKYNGTSGTTPLTNIVQIETGKSFSLALDINGQIWSFGSNDEGQLGNGGQGEVCATDTICKKYAVPVIDSFGTVMQGFKQISAGDEFVLALHSDGTVWAWGANDFGQLGIGSTEQKNYPTQILGLQDIVMVSAGANNGYALDKWGHVWSWGYGGAALGNGQEGEDVCSYYPCQLSLTLVLEAEKSLPLNHVVSISAGREYAIVLKSDTSVWGWGVDSSGTLGHAEAFDVWHATPIKKDATSNLTNIVAVSAGDTHALAVDTAGQVWAWGDNSDGQLGQGTNTGSSTCTSTVCEIYPLAVPNTNVSKANTTTKLVSSASTSVYGQEVTFTATVSGGNVAGTNIVFRDGAATISGCSAVPLTNAQAKCTTRNLGVGNHVLTASYSGDAWTNSSTGSFRQVVGKASTRTTITGVPANVAKGSYVTVAVTVAAVAPGAGTPAGTVSVGEVTSSNTSFASCSITLVTGSGSCKILQSTAGSFKFTAHYNGSGMYGVSDASPVTLTVK